MPGFGSYPFGSTPFGRDPSVASGPRGAFLPAAPNYDGSAQDWQTDEDGRHVSIHPIDNGVQLAMFAQKGELPLSPTTGNTLLQCNELGTQRLQAEVENIVKAANPIARYLTDGSIEILRIDVEFRPVNGTLLVTLNYRNNITAREEVATNRQ
jgi:hypothetical protein